MRASGLVGPVVVHSGDTIQYANEAFCALLDLDSPNEISQQPLQKFVVDEYHDRLTAQFEQLTQTETPTLGLSIELADATGTPRDVIAVSSLVEWEDDTQIHTSFIDVSGDSGTTDVSLRENALREVPVGVTIADARRDDEPLIYVNDGFVELTGYPREEILGKNCRFLQGEKTREEPVAKMRQAIDGGEPVTVELRNYRKDGTMFWNRVTISPIYDEIGTPTHFLGFQEDISAARIYEQEKSLFEEHAEASDQMMFITDADGIIEYVNPAFEQITGYSAAEAIGKNPRLLKSDEQDETFYEQLWETIEAGDVWESELTNRTKSGELIRVNQKIVPVTDGEGEVTHFTAIERDVSKERLTQQVLDVLERVLRHNVRTAINVIDGYAEYLDTDPDKSERKAATRAIQNQTTALKHISEKLTTIREMLQGRAEPSPLEVSKIKNLVTRAQAEFENADISLTTTGEDNLRIQNGSVLQIALDTAIENAVEHNDQETPQVEVTVQHEEGAETAVVKIADNGPGIPDSEWEIVEAGIETPLEHTSGIGLWILYWSVTALGGTVDRTENEPRGTVLTLTVPVESDTETHLPE